MEAVAEQAPAAEGTGYRARAEAEQASAAGGIGYRARAEAEQVPSVKAEAVRGEATEASAVKTEASAVKTEASAATDVARALHPAPSALSRELSQKEMQDVQSAAIQMGVPQQLEVRVECAERAKDGLLFSISLQLDGVQWQISPREKHVLALHSALKELMLFMPDVPIERRWLWRGAEQPMTVAKRLQDYLTELTINGQWVWDEATVLRQFLQIPITSEKRQARELLMKDIKTHKQRTLRSKMLDDIRSFPANALRRSEFSFDSSDGPQKRQDTAPS